MVNNLYIYVSGSLCGGSRSEHINVYFWMFMLKAMVCLRRNWNLFLELKIVQLFLCMCWFYFIFFCFLLRFFVFFFSCFFFVFVFFLWWGCTEYLTKKSFSFVLPSTKKFKQKRWLKSNFLFIIPLSIYVLFVFKWFQFYSVFLNHKEYQQSIKCHCRSIYFGITLFFPWLITFYYKRQFFFLFSFWQKN